MDDASGQGKAGLDVEAATSVLRAIFQTGQDALGVSRRGIIDIVSPRCSATTTSASSSAGVSPTCSPKRAATS